MPRIFTAEQFDEAQKFFKSFPEQGSEVINAFKPSTTRVIVQDAQEGQRVISYNDKGIEATNTAHKGDKILTFANENGQPVYVKDPNGNDVLNQWIQTPEKFVETYKPAENGLYQPMGETRQFVRVNEEVNFPAPWDKNETIYARSGDYICISNKNGVYCVEEELFNKSYQIIENPEHGKEQEEYEYD